MATVNLSPLFNGVTNFDSTGTVLAGGLIYTYQAGSSTPLATYTTVNGTIANTNPIVLGTDGKLPQELWLQSGYSYKFILETASNVIVQTYDNIAGILTQIPTASPTIPSGCIIIWSGSTGSIPSGYLLCDGTNGTPDLRNSFVLGAGNSYTVGQTGGSTDAIVVSHTHTATVTDPGHFHVQNYGGGTSSPAGLTAPSGTPISTSSSNTNSATTGISVANSTTGTSGTNANMPPYYALAYIMKS
jgi:ribonuclease BN (tRNA processing enzyme)